MNDEANIVEDTKLECSVAYFSNISFELESGHKLNQLSVAFKTFGNLNNEKSNAILICHALTGDQYVTGYNPITKRDGWWSRMVGPGKPIDTDKYFVICSNVLGGCAGTLGPKEYINNKKLSNGNKFPSITIKDMVNTQNYLIDFLKIKKLFAVVGGSMGAMQALQWSISFPEKVDNIIHIAGALKHSAQNIAFHEVGRQAIMNDANWYEGKYLQKNTIPERGLAVARMIAHITYLSDDAMHRKFGRKLQSRDIISFGFDADFQIESYLRYQGSVFVDRFDANSYLYITRAMDYFDLAKQFNGNLSEAFKNTNAKFFIISFTSDWLYPTQENKDIVIALNSIGADVGFVEIESDKGHDSFLLDVPDFLSALKNFLDKSYEEN